MRAKSWSQEGASSLTVPLHLHVMFVPAPPRKQHDTQHLKHTVQKLFGNQMSLREKQKKNGKTTIQQQMGIQCF